MVEQGTVPGPTCF